MKKNIFSSLALILLIIGLLLVTQTLGGEVRRSLRNQFDFSIWADQVSANPKSTTLAANGQTTNMPMVADFKTPDTVCVNQNFTIQNLSVGGSTYYWNFCSGNLLNTPIGQNLGNQGNLNGPVFVALAKDGNDCYSFITNHWDGTLTRNYYGSSFSNPPVSSVNLGNLGILPIKFEGIQIKKSNGKWYGLINGGMHSDNLFRLDFGNSLSNTPVATNLGNVSSLLNTPHPIYTFQENGNWYSFIANNVSNNIVRLSFGTSLANIPTGVDLGNIGAINIPVGFFPIQDSSGMWYLFVVNSGNNTISRLDFGNSLINIPTGVNLGNISSLNLPRSITILRDCGQVLGFVVNQTNDIVRLTFPNGITSIPVGVSLGNIANFDFPHNISEVFREKDTLYALITNVNSNTLSRIYFPGCKDSSIPSSTLQNPPSISYNVPGTYNISLVVDEGLSSQANFCKQIVVMGPPTITISPSNSVTSCSGDPVTLTASGATSYSWSNGLGTTKSIIVKPTATTTYTVTGTTAGCSSTANTTVTVNPNPTVDITAANGQIVINAVDGTPPYQYSINGIDFQLSETFTDLQGGSYTTVTKDINNCITSKTITVGNDMITIPNFFTPNGDGFHDTWEIKGIHSYPDATIQVFDRFGKLLITYKGSDTGWNGIYHDTPLPSDDYWYVVKLADNMNALKGHVTLKR